MSDLDARHFAKQQYRAYVFYKMLARTESDSDFKAILEEHLVHEHEDYIFWLKLSKQKHFSINKLEVLFFKYLRKIFGLTFTIKILERRTRNILKGYKKYLAHTKNAKMRQDIERAIEHESRHAKQLISQIKEDRVAFISNIILGMNDGLVELSGVLVGFSFAFQEHLIIALTGLITGVSASLSMASSAFMQARYEERKDPKKAGIYTGITYFVVVVILVSPFLFFKEVFFALGLMFVAVLILVNAMSLYTSIVLDRSFVRQVGELLIASIGVGAVAFLIGMIFRVLTGIAV